uniref:Uncharacterized protein n=1 Tax=Meloidogyne enterolobii TaxID=390850 RepID=A0A6V7WY57_MELEN|nr:unnamed protein product [Meloidogyne enterolobii]
MTITEVKKINDLSFQTFLTIHSFLPLVSKTCERSWLCTCTNMYWFPRQTTLPLQSLAIHLQYCFPLDTLSLKYV